MSITSVAVKTGSRLLLQTQKHSPTILVSAGVTAVVVASVLGARATLKLEPVTQQFRDRKDLAKMYRESGSTGESEFSKQDYNHEIFSATREYAFELTKLYGPAVTLGAAGVVSILGAHNILHKRNVAITAAYKALEGTFKQYRERVVSEIGAEKEEAIYQGQYKYEETDSTGKVKKITAFSAAGYSQYARYFDETSSSIWQQGDGYNLMTIRARQNYANDMLRARGHIFLNDVYDLLGLERTSEGQLVGWVIGKGEDKGDHEVDFGLYTSKNPATINFVNGGNEPVVLLDFNVDGLIYDLI